jgi:hypothetical protein
MKKCAMLLFIVSVLVSTAGAADCEIVGVNVSTTYFPPPALTTVTIDYKAPSGGTSVLLYQSVSGGGKIFTIDMGVSPSDCSNSGTTTYQASCDIGSDIAPGSYIVVVKYWLLCPSGTKLCDVEVRQFRLFPGFPVDQQDE